MVDWVGDREVDGTDQKGCLTPFLRDELLIPEKKCYSFRMITEEQQAAIAKFFAAHSVVLGYLFGSQATGLTTRESDADIAILLPHHLTQEKRFELRLQFAGELAKILKLPVDCVILNDTSSLLLRYSIIKEGILLYRQTEADQLTYELNVMSEYFDFQPFSDTYNMHYVKTHL